MYILIAGNCGEPLNYQNMIRAKSHDADQLDEQAVQFRLFDFCFSIDGDDGMLEKDYKAKLTWETRNNVTSPKQAIELVSERLSNRGAYINEKDLEEISDFSSNYGVPFNASMHTELVKGLLDSFKDDYPNWDSSNCY